VGANCHPPFCKTQKKGVVGRSLQKYQQRHFDLGSDAAETSQIELSNQSVTKSHHNYNGVTAYDLKKMAGCIYKNSLTLPALEAVPSYRNSLACTPLSMMGRFN